MRAIVMPDLPPKAAPAQTRRSVSPAIRVTVFIVFILLVPPAISIPGNQGMKEKTFK
jgi:hypothetical protein